MSDLEQNWEMDGLSLSPHNTRSAQYRRLPSTQVLLRSRSPSRARLFISKTHSGFPMSFHQPSTCCGTTFERLLEKKLNGPSPRSTSASGTSSPGPCPLRPQASARPLACPLSSKGPSQVSHPAGNECRHINSSDQRPSNASQLST